MYYDPYDGTQIKAMRYDPTGRIITLSEGNNSISVWGWFIWTIFLAFIALLLVLLVLFFGGAM